VGEDVARASPLGTAPGLRQSLRQVKKLTIGYTGFVTWGELIRRRKAAGFVEQRHGKGSHRQFVHPDNGQVITVAVHTRREVGSGLARRILKEAGL
jgi:predicted RNA binding protein YcfA (HicA-like mRNA interferase family)